MKGIGLILPNADFSGSPLGRISIAESADDIAAEAVAAYAKAIGSSQYNSTLQPLVAELMNSGLWDKISAIYPMLGATLSAKKVNLKFPDTLALAFGANASSISNGVNFVDTIGVDAIQCDEVSKKFSGYTSFFAAKQIKGTYNGAILTSFKENNSIRIGAASNSGLQFYMSRFGMLSFVSGASTNVRKLTFHAEDTYIYNIADGVKADNIATNNNASLDVVVPTFIGADYAKLPIAPGSNSDLMFSGDVYCYAFGWMSEADSVKFDSLMNKFVADLKGL